MTTTQTASEQITEEVTSWPGVTAGPGGRGAFSFKLGRRELGHLHGDRVLHLGFPKAVWHELHDAGPDRLPPRLPRQAGLRGAADRERGGHSRRDRAAAAQLRPRGLAARPARLGLRAMEALIDRLRGALAEAGLERAVLSHPETLAHLCLFDPAVEEWPVANPFVASPALLVLEPTSATLLVASFHAAHARAARCPSSSTARTTTSAAPAPEVELEAALRGLAGGRGRDRRSRPPRCRSRSRTCCGPRAPSSRRDRRARRARAAHQAPVELEPSGAPRASPTSSRAPSRSSRSPV